MDATNLKLCQEELQQSNDKTSFNGKFEGNTFADSFADPFCKLNLKATMESFQTANSHGNEKRRERTEGSVGSIAVAQRKMEAAPTTPGRPVFSFSVSKKSNFPSKWDDAEKWLIGTASSHGSPARHSFNLKQFDSAKFSKQCHGFKQQTEVFVEKSRVTEDKISEETVLNFNDSSSSFDPQDAATTFYSASVPADVILKDKFTNEVERFLPKFACSKQTKGGVFFKKHVSCEPMKDVGTEVIYEIKHRDTGTEMTPIGSTTPSISHTPLKSTSPARHNTPENRSGPLTLMSSGTANSLDIAHLQELHLAKLQNGPTLFDSITPNWSSREEEEEEISKSLRNFEMNSGCRRSVSESRTSVSSVWEEEKAKYCLRYQAEEAKIQAWVNLQSAKAEAQARKLEVKIQKMRSDLQDKLMKRMANVQKTA
ncbi:hypothetical protein Nepgr_019401 [Nepenthes gracilis]|uniref:Remorin C-terminal domain-containing protein n=1 Tax=Nepenthes gracilis TaxID=150966 RepID=A0AAD3SV29_NEPGR|nr:hypothetical protein Nepgr_019401 [Nepenthes gracilis]